MHKSTFSELFTVLHTKFYDYDSQEFVKGMDEIGSS